MNASLTYKLLGEVAEFWSELPDQTNFMIFGIIIFFVQLFSREDFKPHYYGVVNVNHGPNVFSSVILHVCITGQLAGYE